MKPLAVVAAVVMIGSLVTGCGSEDPVAELREELADGFAYVNEVRVHRLGPFSWTSYSEFEVSPSWELEGETEAQRFDSLIEGMRAYDYDGGQSDPGLMDEVGSGNCQAMTLYAKALLDEAQMENSIVLEETHMFNRVLVDEDWWQVDFAKGTLREEVEK